MSALGLLLAATPSPSDVQIGESQGGSPGFIGFVVTFLLALAAVGLFLSLTKQLRVVDRRARQQGLLDDEDGGGEGGGPGADGATDRDGRDGDSPR